MKIKTLITIFTNLIPLYQEAYDNNFVYSQLRNSNLQLGICYASNEYFEDCLKIFSKRGFYRKHTNKGGYLFDTPNKLWSSNENIIEKAIKPRLKFLKQQVIYLKKLQKQGYTDV